jgi:hypothetical protein
MNAKPYALAAAGAKRGARVAVQVEMIQFQAAPR